MATEYRYSDLELENIPKIARNRRFLLAFAFFIVPVFLTLISLNEIDNHHLVFPILFLFSTFGVIFHFLSSRIEQFSLKHKNDIILVNEEYIELRAINAAPIMIARDGKLVVKIKHYAAGQAIFCLSGNCCTLDFNPTKVIMFTNHLEHFTTLLREIAPAFRWPPDEFD